MVEVIAFVVPPVLFAWMLDYSRFKRMPLQSLIRLVVHMRAIELWVKLAWCLFFEVAAPRYRECVFSAERGE